MPPRLLLPLLLCALAAACVEAPRWERAKSGAIGRVVDCESVGRQDCRDGFAPFPSNDTGFYAECGINGRLYMKGWCDCPQAEGADVCS